MKTFSDAEDLSDSPSAWRCLSAALLTQRLHVSRAERSPQTSPPAVRCSLRRPRSVDVEEGFHFTCREGSREVCWKLFLISLGRGWSQAGRGAGRKASTDRGAECDQRVRLEFSAITLHREILSDVLPTCRLPIGFAALLSIATVALATACIPDTRSSSRCGVSGHEVFPRPTESCTRWPLCLLETMSSSWHSSPPSAPKRQSEEETSELLTVNAAHAAWLRLRPRLLDGLDLQQGPG